MGDILKQDEIEEVQYSVWYHQRHRRDELHGLVFDRIDPLGSIVFRDPAYFFEPWLEPMEGQFVTPFAADKFWYLVPDRGAGDIVNFSERGSFHVSEKTFVEMKGKYGAFV